MSRGKERASLFCPLFYMTEDLIRTAVQTPYCVSPSCAALSCGKIWVTDGFTEFVCTFSDCGCLSCEIPVIRPYRYISRDPQSGRILALGGNCQSRIYCLSCTLAEGFSFSPDISAGFLKSLDPLPNGNIIATYRDLVCLLNRRGIFMNTLRVNNFPDTEFDCCVASDDGLTLVYTRNDAQYIELSFGDTDSLLAVPAPIRIKNLFRDCGGVIYAFCGVGYIYSFITPLVVDGVFLNCALSDLASIACPFLN